MAVAEVVVVPLGTGHPSVSQYVAKCVAVLQESGLKYQLSPMGTIVEGEIDEILAVIRKMHEVPFNEGAQRVSTTFRIDDRRDKPVTFESKISAVEEKLNK